MHLTFHSAVHQLSHVLLCVRESDWPCISMVPEGGFCAGTDGRILRCFYSYSTIHCSQADSMGSCHVWLSVSDCCFLWWIFEWPSKWCTHSAVWLFGCYMAGAMWNCCHLSKHSLYTIQFCTSLQCHFIQSHICKVHGCLVVTCHLHFWQNDLDLLYATVVTRGWNRYQNENQHRKLTLEKKILRLLLLGLEPTTFPWQVLCSSYHWDVPAPWYFM